MKGCVAPLLAAEKIHDREGTNTTPFPRCGSGGPSSAWEPLRNRAKLLGLSVPDSAEHGKLQGRVQCISRCNGPPESVECNPPPLGTGVHVKRTLH